LVLAAAAESELAMLHNEDESAKSLSDYICDLEGYPWDTY